MFIPSKLKEKSKLKRLFDFINCPKVQDCHMNNNFCNFAIFSKR